MTDDEVMKLEDKVVRELKPHVKAIYEKRMKEIKAARENTNKPAAPSKQPEVPAAPS